MVEIFLLNITNNKAFQNIFKKSRKLCNLYLCYKQYKTCPGGCSFLYLIINCYINFEVLKSLKLFKKKVDIFFIILSYCKSISHLVSHMKTIGAHEVLCCFTTFKSIILNQ